MDSEIEFVVSPETVTEVPTTPKVAVIGDGSIGALAAAVAAGADAPYAPLPVRPQGPAIGPLPELTDDVEYDLTLPGGGKVTFDAKGGAGQMDTLARAQAKLMQLKAVNNMLREMRGQKPSQRGKHAKKAKARKKNRMAKASRKRNR